MCVRASRLVAVRILYVSKVRNRGAWVLRTARHRASTERARGSVNSQLSQGLAHFGVLASRCLHGTGGCASLRLAHARAAMAIERERDVIEGY
jgi:hypothetical protein